MSVTNYIPVGLTSLVKTGDTALQLQTEYAGRPYPRVTTTIQSNGQVLHKVEQKLPGPVQSPDDQSRIEALIRRQHSEVTKVIESGAQTWSADQPDSKPDPSPAATDSSAQPVLLSPSKLLPIWERLDNVPGVQRVYRLDAEGNFRGTQSVRQFKKTYPKIFKNLSAILDLFPMCTGPLGGRKRGVYEVEPRRLYLLSCGTECFFVALAPDNSVASYEAEFKSLLQADAPIPHLTGWN
ncbi:MAG: hypothetical protein ACE5FH_09790 [Candidatus Zixiibacteriota bacterium]